MIDQSRTIHTLAASPDLATLRAELDRACGELEDAGTSVEALGPELVKLGAAISLALNGPRETMHGLLSLAHQIANEFPAEFVSVRAEMSSAGRG